MQTKKVNVFEPSKRKILCIANEHDYLGDGTIIREDELEVGRQYTFVKGEVMSYGSMVHLEELPCKYGYQAYLFEELQPHDEGVLERNYKAWLREKLDEAETDRKEGRVYSMEEFRSMMDELIIRHQNSQT